MIRKIFVLCDAKKFFFVYFNEIFCLIFFLLRKGNYYSRSIVTTSVRGYVQLGAIDTLQFVDHCQLTPIFAYAQFSY